MKLLIDIVLISVVPMETAPPNETIIKITLLPHYSTSGAATLIPANAVRLLNFRIKAKYPKNSNGKIN